METPLTGEDADLEQCVEKQRGFLTRQRAVGKKENLKGLTEGPKKRKKENDGYEIQALVKGRSMLTHLSSSSDPFR
jgi:hypothetical protein